LTENVNRNINIIKNSETLYKILVAPKVDCVEAMDTNIGLPFKSFFVSHVLTFVDVTIRNNTYLPAKFVMLGILHVSTTHIAF
jgi:hypothetical protein